MQVVWFWAALAVAQQAPSTSALLDEGDALLEEDPATALAQAEWLLQKGGLDVAAHRRALLLLGQAARSEGQADVAERAQRRATLLEAPGDALVAEARPVERLDAQGIEVRLLRDQEGWVAAVAAGGEAGIDGSRTAALSNAQRLVLFAPGGEAKTVWLLTEQGNAIVQIEVAGAIDSTTPASSPVAPSPGSGAPPASRLWQPWPWLSLVGGAAASAGVVVFAASAITFVLAEDGRFTIDALPTAAAAGMVVGAVLAVTGITTVAADRLLFDDQDRGDD